MLKYTTRIGPDEMEYAEQMSEAMPDQVVAGTPDRRDRERGAAHRGVEGTGRGGERLSAHRGVGRRLFRVSVRAQLRRRSKTPTITFSSATGSRVVVDDVSLDLLNGAEIDFVEDLMGASFQIKNPNAASSCGCGNSFSI